MENILQGLHELEGVHGAIVADGSGQLVAYRSHSMYDANLQQQVSRAIASAVDSVKLIQEDWESINAQFSEGKLLIRNLTPSSSGQSFTLTLIADARLNPSFATVAIRVAIGKLKAVLQSGSNTGALNVSNFANKSNAVAGNGFSSAAAGSSAGSIGKQPHTEVANSGLSWSGIGSASTASASGSGVEVADAASSTVLTTCTKALAKHVGPMAKLFVKEAVRKLCPDRPFSKDMAGALVSEIAKNISNPAEAAQFQSALMKSL